MCWSIYPTVLARVRYIDCRDQHPLLGSELEFKVRSAASGGYKVSISRLVFVGWVGAGLARALLLLLFCVVGL
jgi:hypothetical protein